MMRIAFTLAASALAFGAVFALLNPAPASAGAPVSLRSAARITGAQIRLGDLFDNAGEHAQDVVASAPAPGTSLLFEAAWLVTTAHNYGLDWQPPSGETAIRVQRAARTVDNTELAERVAQQLGVAIAKTKLQFDTQYRIEVPLGDQPGYAVENAEINPTTNRFTAELRIPSDNQAAAPVRVAGHLVAMMDIPVLSRPMVPGEQVAAADVTWAQVPSASVPTGDVTDPQDLIGRTPRHPLQAGQPLRPLDLQVPILIKRNDAVLIVLERPGLYMTAEGKALEDGGRGAAIRVINTQSNRAIDAVVLASGQVAVRPPGVQQASAR
jgi:flagellar basal body P-ring formation protein FlgA